MSGTTVALSVVSHAQNWLVNQLLADLTQLREVELAVVVTQNVPDRDALTAPPGAEVVVNEQPKGFGANHNAAFRRCRAPYFCVINPDVRLNMDPFPVLLQALQARGNAGIAAPQVCDPDGRTEDSARRFPTVLRLLRKLLPGARGADYPAAGGPVAVDWVAGMFMLFRSEAFRAAGGFDERFFLYYEDVDICRRLGLLGYGALYVPEATVIHDARRESRRNPRRMGIRAASAARYLTRRYR